MAAQASDKSRMRGAVGRPACWRAVVGDDGVELRSLRGLCSGGGWGTPRTNWGRLSRREWVRGLSDRMEGEVGVEGEVEDGRTLERWG